MTLYDRMKDYVTYPNCGYENNLAEAKFCLNCSQKFDRSELDE